MHLETLKIFCDVVRTASFSRGAAENDITQGSASQAVHALEIRLGVKLIDRSCRPLVPTRHGRVFYDGCRDLVARYAELEQRVKTLENDQNVVGTVRVASIYSVGLPHMVRFVDRFHALYPGATVRMEYQHPTRVIESVTDGSAELGLISFPRRWPELTAIPWREEEMVVAVHPDHPFAHQEHVEIGQLDGEPFVHFDSDLPIRKAIDRFLRKHGVQVEPALVFDNIENIKRAVEAPSGVAILPEPTLAREVAAGSLVAVRFRDQRPVRPLAIIHRAGGGLGLTAQRFLDLLLSPEAAPAKAPEAQAAIAAASGGTT